MKRKILSSFLLLGLGLSASGQKNVGFLLQAREDANVLAKAYLKPYGEMLGNNLNAGWYTSAAPHKVLGFDVTLMASYTMVPASGESFDVSKLPLQKFSVSSGKTIAPTMAGKMESSNLPTLTPNVPGGQYATFTLPNGSESNAMVSPMIQAAVGLPYHTEIMGRYMPEMKLGNYGKLGMWGVGVKHSLKDYFPFIKRVPFWNVSVLGAVTQFNSSMALPDNSILEKGNLDIASTAYTGRLLIGANFPVVALYTGVGYGTANSNFDISGSLDGSTSEKLLGLEYKPAGIDFNAGVRFRIGVFALHADYSVGDYSMVTAGVGVSFR